MTSTEGGGRTSWFARSQRGPALLRSLVVTDTTWWKRVGSSLNVRTPGIAGGIRAELPSYALVPFAEHVETVCALSRIMVADIASGAAPSARAFAYLRTASRRRAHYGMPVRDVLGAIHFTQRAMWAVLRDVARTDESTLVELVEPMSLWSQAMSQAVVEVYDDRGDTADERIRAALRERMIAYLGDPDSAESASEILRGLDYDPDGEFQVLACQRASWPGGTADALQRAFRDIAGVAQVGTRDGAIAVVVQGPGIARIVESLHRTVGHPTPVGVGLCRVGFRALPESYADAVAALHVAERRGRGTVHFGDSWFDAVIAGQRDRLHPLLDLAVRAAADHPDLAAAVRAFAERRYSLAAVGKALHIHANTAAYRLERWQQLTGLDPRVFSDLARSLAAIAESPAAATDVGSPQ